MARVLDYDRNDRHLSRAGLILRPADLRVRDAIVVGAGVCGLSATLALQGKDLDVLVLEARGRVGGRMFRHTLPSGEAVELGAGWIHNYQTNPVYQEALKGNIPVTKTDYANIAVFPEGCQGIPLDETEVKKQYTFNEKCKERLVELASDESFLKQTTKPSLEDAVSRLLSGKPLSRDLNPSLVKLIFDLTIVDSHCRLLRELDYKTWAKDEASGGDFGCGGGDVMPTCGVSKIFEEHYERVKNNILLNHPVSAIELLANGLVKVTTRQGDFFARQVLVTAPIPVLNAGVIQFSPPLPQEKISAIRTFAENYAQYNKVVVTFEDPFWPEDKDYFLFLPSSKRDYDDQFLVFFTNRGVHPGTLVSFLSGQKALEFEKYSDEEIKSRLMDTLRAMFGSAVPDEPVSLVVTRWGQDPWARGGYSNCLTARFGGHQEAVKKSVDNRLFFGGEALAWMCATLHGAWDSGREQAAQMIAARSQPKAAL